MRIEGPGQPRPLTGKRARSTSDSESVYAPTEEAGYSAPSGESAPLSATGGIETLLALQAIEDPLFAKRKAVRRGHAMLDALDAVKADLLVGQVPEGKLNRLIAFVGQARSESEPGLDAVLNDIDLRARVELAKLGHYPAL